jgi:hypothetical protein
MLAQWSVCVALSLERLSLLKGMPNRFAENKEIDSCTKVRIGMHGSYPIREEKCFKTFWC